MTRVQLRTSSPVVRAGLEGLLRSYSQIYVLDESSGEFSSPDDSNPDAVPDVIVAEAERGENVDAIVHGSAGDVPVILLVRAPAGDWAMFRRREIRAVLPDHVTGPQLAAAIEAVAAGLGVFDPDEIEEFAPTQQAYGLAEPLAEALTPREIEVLRAMAEGLANKQIADRLGISENTTKFHVASVMGKLGASSRTEAVMLGVRHGIVLI